MRHLWLADIAVVVALCLLACGQQADFIADLWGLP